MHCRDANSQTAADPGPVSTSASRRSSLLALTAAAVALAPRPAQAFADESAEQVERRQEVDTTITDKVYLDIGRQSANMMIGPMTVSVTQQPSSGV